MSQVVKRRIHWHIVLTHFPISLFGVTAGFQVLHLFLLPTCFEIASNVCLIGGTVFLVPSVISGWATWKKQYRGFRSPVFLRKITIADFMLGLSLPLTVWRMAFPSAFINVAWGTTHWLYFSGTILLIIGASLEGYFGGTLHHR